MTPFMSLLLPVVLSAVAVFVLSSIIHMAMPWHKSDFSSAPDEDALMDAVRPFSIAPGQYMVPRPWSISGMKSPEFMTKMNKGPVFLMTVIPAGPFNMGKTMGTWFLFTLFVAAVAGWVTGTIVRPGGHDRAIFHYAAIITFLCYTVGAWPMSIWYHQKWSTAFKGAVDALFYAVASALIFTWMWPKA